MKVSVSVLSNYDDVSNAVLKVNKTSADFLHIDVMDGKFVNNLKFPLELVEKLKSISEKKIDMHLMVEDEDLIKEYASYKPYYLTLHVEILKDNTLIKYIKSLGIKVGLAINPETRVENLSPYIKDIDLILFMSVNPGKGGQKFKKSVIQKIKKIRKILNNKVIISVDGGVNDKTISYCRAAGCDMVVSGSYVTNSDNYEEKILSLK